MGLRRRGDALIPALRRLSPAWVVITIALVLELGGAPVREALRYERSGLEASLLDQLPAGGVQHRLVRIAGVAYQAGRQLDDTRVQGPAVLFHQHQFAEADVAGAAAFAVIFLIAEMAYQLQHAAAAAVGVARDLQGATGIEGLQERGDEARGPVPRDEDVRPPVPALDGPPVR